MTLAFMMLPVTLNTRCLLNWRI